METQGSGRPSSSSRHHSSGRRWRIGLVGPSAVALALVAGGAATLTTASAHHVTSTTTGTGTKADGSDFHAGTSFVVGTQIMDSATLKGYTINPQRSVVFFLYGTNDPTCSAAAIATFKDTPTGKTGAHFAGPVFAGPYTTATVGTYHWTAEVTFKGKIESGPTACSDEPESTTKATPAIATTQSAGGNIGVVLSDTATVSGGFSPTGTVTFALYGPSDSTCSGTPVYTSPPETLSGGKASSGSFTTTSTAGAGTYQWVATYSGDANNSGVASTCSSEAVVVSGGSGSGGITTGGSGTQAISTPGTGVNSGFSGLTLGAALLLGGLSLALVSAVIPRRRRI